MAARNNTCNTADRSPRFPVVFVVAAIAAMIGMMVWSGSIDYAESNAHGDEVSRTARLSHTTARILHLDEVLTMSARMAALTGKTEWIDRYHQYEPELDRLIKEAMAMAPSAKGLETATATDAANLRLVEIEKASFDLVRTQRLEEAADLLNGQEYRRQKEIYANGMKAFTRELQAQQQNDMSRNTRHHWLSFYVHFAASAVAGVLWCLALWKVASSWRCKVEELRAVADSLRKSDQLLTVGPAVIYSCETSGGYAATFISGNVKEQLGYETHEFTDDPGFWADHIHPEDKSRVLSGLSRVYEEGHHIHEYRFRHKGGKYLWMRDESNLALSSTGEPVEIVGYWTDITERKQAEEAVQRSEEQLRVTLASIGDGVIATDTDRRVIRLNKRAEELTGWSITEAKSRHLGEVFNIINEETRAPAEDPIAKVLATGRIEGLANHTVLIARDGVERAIADSAAPIRDDSGAVIGVVLVFRDVTEERRHQEEKDKLLHELGERVKELDCLYGLSQVNQKPDISQSEIFQETARLLRSAFQYPDIASARVSCEGRVFD
ncbi:MAG: PAS domain S-box protein, partial [Planctomycetes bacterium]|nr:PAS domain S-box protein [Planctomycetota bacterium]